MQPRAMYSAAIRQAVLGFAGLAVAGNAPAYPVATVDAMVTDQTTVYFMNPGQPIHWMATGAGIAGGEREIIGHFISQQGAGTLIHMGVTLNEFFYRQTGAVTTSAELIWDGPDNSSTFDPRGLGGLDLTGGGHFDTLHLSSDTTPYHVNLSVDVYTDAGNASRYSTSQTGSRLHIPFSAFTPLLGAGASFNDVGAIRIKLGEYAGTADYGLNSVRARSDLSIKQIDELVVDALDPGVANPGDVIRYTWVIENQKDVAGAMHSGIVVNSAVDPQTTLVAGSVVLDFGPATIVYGNGAADTAVRVDIAALPDDSFTTLHFDVRVKPALAPGTTQLWSQATGYASGRPSLLSDYSAGYPVDGPPAATVTSASAGNFPDSVFVDGFDLP